MRFARRHAIMDAQTRNFLSPFHRSGTLPRSYYNIMKFVYQDEKLLVCVKPAGVAVSDVPELARKTLGAPAAPLYPVHRLDQPVGGLLLLARTRRAAGDLGRDLSEGRFVKSYLAAVRGAVAPEAGTLTDWLLRDRGRRMTVSVPEGTPGAQYAALDYQLVQRLDERCLLRVTLRTGRTHQIRAQFSARGWPLLGDRKYGGRELCPLALWSCRLAFDHPKTGKRLDFFLPPPKEAPWRSFDAIWKL